MKKLVFFTLNLVYTLLLFSQIDTNYTNYFLQKSLRIDLIHTGNYKDETISIIELKELPYWSGSFKHLIDWSNYGNNYVEVYDSLSNKLIYSFGYNSLFKEWQRLPEATKKTLSFYEVIEIPYPLSTIKIVFKSRDFKTGKLVVVNEYYIPHNYYLIKKDAGNISADFKLLIGDSTSFNKRLDIVFLAEGYVKSEMKKFENDANKLAKFLLSYEPFKSFANKINFWVVFSESKESGTDDPNKNIYRKTVFNTTFNTFGSDRYLTTTDIRTVYDYANLVPHDQIYILVNTDKYGGGGIFNFFSLTSVDNSASNLVFVHEFGHSFAGLADEYYYDNEAYTSYYPNGIEPWEKNITSLVNFNAK